MWEPQDRYLDASRHRPLVVPPRTRFETSSHSKGFRVPAPSRSASSTAPTPVLAPLTRPANGALSAFTVDVEDWYQSCVDFDAPITERVVKNVDRVLAVLDDCGVKGTFFVQGRVAETFPRLLEVLIAEGHEVQSHGYSHRPLFAMSRKELRTELERARTTVEDASGTRVSAFRAQDFSVLRENLWALDTLAEVGFEVDSSIFPMRARRYGIAGWPVAPHFLRAANGSRILEVPVAIWARGSWRFPVAGGGYFRLLPRLLLERGLHAIVASGRPAVVYCHPYEFNPQELADYSGRVSRTLALSQGLGRQHFAARIRRLLSGLPFGRFDDVLTAWGLA
jgi:polysaccharide deacetylase family protein (PEP-CTERM system associated)